MRIDQEERKILLAALNCIEDYDLHSQAEKALRENINLLNKNKDKQRTYSQNNSMHLWFDQIANLCREEGVTVYMILQKSMDIRVGALFIKYMWKTIQMALFSKESTTQLDKGKGEIDEIIEHMILFFGKHFKLELPPFHNDPNKHNKGAPLKSESY